ncbi:MAG: FHA domain-containing protein [Actinomycetota bacterium]|nr:FHA domain-containing protein [Actinomycetota bacterium]
METAARLLVGERELTVDGTVAIGRDDDNDVVLPVKTVSRHHAVLAYSNGSWTIEDRRSANGTFLNDTPVPVGVPLRLRDGDRIRVGSETLLFSWPAGDADPERTDEVPNVPAAVTPQLSPLQLQVVRTLCRDWVAGSTLDHLPSNEQIAAHLGTPGAGETVKAALRRVYAKAGITDLPAHAKRRALCRIARQRGWL